MNYKYVAVVLAVMLLSAEANNVHKLSNEKLIQHYQGKQDRVELTADVNEYVDNTIGKVIPFLERVGLDPMPLPDIEEGFEVRPILITYSAWLRVTNGYMSGLQNIKRSGNQIISYLAKVIRVRIELQFSDLEFNYRYLVQVMNIGPTGGLIGSLSEFKIVFDLILDFNNDELQLQEFSMTDIGRLKVRFTGNILTDWLINPVASVFTRIFDDIIIKIVEINIRNVIQDVIVMVNGNVKDLMDVLESHN